MGSETNDLSFKIVSSIIPDLDENGNPIEYMPQSEYKDRTKIPLHEYGFGPFCRFKIPEKFNGITGVYIIQVDGEIKYVGECEDLGSRFNNGYGNISPRNCYKGGQSTNCRINNLILQVYKEGAKIKLLFYETNKRFDYERQLIQGYNPEWNRSPGITIESSKNHKTPDQKASSGKYFRLEKYLKDSEKSIEILSFDEIEKILGFKLPASAYKHRPWWANGGHSQANAWLNAGWKVTSIVIGKTVKFVKVSR